MHLNIRSIILIIIGILVIAVGIRALKSSGSLSADVLDQTDQINNAINK